MTNPSGLPEADYGPASHRSEASRARSISPMNRPRRVPCFEPKPSPVGRGQAVLSPRARPPRLRSQEEGPGGDDELAGLQAIEHFERVSERCAELHGPFSEAPLATLHLDVDDVAVAYGLHCLAGHERDLSA